MILATFIKQPPEVLAYDVDFRPWLTALTDTASSVVVSVPAGITKDSHSMTDGVVTIWLSGGTAGASYKIDLTITTAQGRVKEDQIVIKIKDF